MSGAHRPGALAAAVASVLVLLVGCSHDAGPGDTGVADAGLTFEEDPAGYSAGMDTDAPARIAFGLTILQNTGDDPVRLTSAGLSYTGDDGAALVRVRAVDIHDHPGHLVGVTRWPYRGVRGISAKLRGLVMRPGDEVELLYVVRVRRTGHYEWTQPQVRYSYKGDVLTATSVAHFTIDPPAFGS